MLGEYITSKTPIRMRHNTCGYEWDTTTPASFIYKNSRCPECSKNKSSVTTDEFKQEVYDLVGDEYTVDGEYVNIRTKIPIIHNVCGTRWMVRPNDFKQGSRCPKCAHAKKAGKKAQRKHLRRK